MIWPIIGLPATLSNTFGWENVWGRKREPTPATGMIAFMFYGWFCRENQRYEQFFLYVTKNMLYNLLNNSLHAEEAV